MYAELAAADVKHGRMEKVKYKSKPPRALGKKHFPKENTAITQSSILTKNEPSRPNENQEDGRTCQEPIM